MTTHGGILSLVPAKLTLHARVFLIELQKEEKPAFCKTITLDCFSFFMRRVVCGLGSIPWPYVLLSIQFVLFLSERLKARIRTNLNISNQRSTGRRDNKNC